MSISHCWAAAVGAVVVSVLPAQAKVAAEATPQGTTSSGSASAPERALRPATAGLVVGIVDLERAFELYPRAIKERERLAKLADSAQEQIDKVRKRVQELRGTIEILKEGSYERDAKQLDLELAMNEHKGLASLLQGQMQVEQMRVKVAIYQDLDAAIGRLAKDRGVHLVLTTEAIDAVAPDKADKDSPRMVQNRLLAYERRQVWFAAEELDLTADLIKLLQVWPLESSKDAPAVPPPAANGETGGGGGQ